MLLVNHNSKLWIHDVKSRRLYLILSIWTRLMLGTESRDLDILTTNLTIAHYKYDSNLADLKVITVLSLQLIKVHEIFWYFQYKAAKNFYKQFLQIYDNFDNGLHTKHQGHWNENMFDAFLNFGNLFPSLAITKQIIQNRKISTLTLYTLTSVCKLSTLSLYISYGT